LEFSLPLHIRWDVDFRKRIGRPKRIARQIREISPRFVELKFEGDKGISELSSIVSEIHKCHPKVEATVRLTAKAVAAARWGYPVTFLWAIEGDKTFSRCIPGDAHAVSFTPDEETILLLPEVLEDFAESRAGELHLPNVNAVRALAARGHIPVPRAEQIREVSERIARNPVPLKGKQLIVHDFFLCRSLRNAFPDEVENRVGFSGCQAGTQLVHIDWDGNVYPCDALPIRLGNLLETPFERIWRSPAREHVVEAIHAAPNDCTSCDAYSGCFGGCRGLAPLASGSTDSGKATGSEESAASFPKAK
jgi:radical SAM protein with 4Fe4S-binding SPASM domain